MDRKSPFVIWNVERIAIEPASSFTHGREFRLRLSAQLYDGPRCSDDGHKLLNGPKLGWIDRRLSVFTAGFTTTFLSIAGQIGSKLFIFLSTRRPDCCGRHNIVSTIYVSINTIYFLIRKMRGYASALQPDEFPPLRQRESVW